MSSLRLNTSAALFNTRPVMAPVVPPLPICNVPPRMRVISMSPRPVYVLLPVSVSVPAPVLTSPPDPLISWLILVLKPFVSITARVLASIVIGRVGLRSNAPANRNDAAFAMSGSPLKLIAPPGAPRLPSLDTCRTPPVTTVPPV